MLLNIGLVLSGGMAKGAYQVGALAAISEFIPRSEIGCISCASVGVLNGYAYAVGKLERAFEIWHGLCSEKEKMLISQVLRSNILGDTVKVLYDKDNTPESTFYTTLLDMANCSVAYKNLASVKKKMIPGYLMASVAMPIYNRAIRIDSIPYFDGAMVDNIPVYPLVRHKPDYTICIYFDDTSYRFENAYFDNRVIKITFPSDSVIRESVVFTKDSIDKMMTVGYERTRHILRSVLYDGYNDLDAVYKAIELQNGGTPQSFRITGDVLVTNINKVVQKFASRRIII